MATKTQRARNEMERSGASRNSAKTTRKGPSTSRRSGPSKDGLGTAARNLMSSKTRLSKAMVDLEDSATGKPSRKSTRGSENRTKPEAQLRTAKTIVTRQAPRGTRGSASRRGH